MLQITRCPTALAVFSLSMMTALPAAGQVIYEDIKVMASDGARGDYFGSSVAMSGTIAIVGAPYDDGAGLSSGAAYLIDTATGQQLFKLTASDAEPNDRFGFSVAISDTTAIVGAFLDDDAGSESGSAYLFDTATGQQLFKLVASDAQEGDLFGYSVAISGTTAIVGAHWADDAGYSSGSAYLFDTTTGQQTHKLAASNAARYNRFGQAVAISGTTAIVGAEVDYAGGVDSGSAYLFDTITGEQLFQLIANDASDENAFAQSVSIWGTTAIVGARYDDQLGQSSGAAYLYDTTTGEQLFKLIASDAEPWNQFGSSVSIWGTTAIVGAWRDNDGGYNSGSAYLFDTITGQEFFKLAASDGDNRDEFGISVSISDGASIVGAHAVDGDGLFSELGAVYLFATCPADLIGGGVLDLFDIAAFLVAYSTMDPAADFTDDGLFNFFDVSAFLAAFATGCP